MKRSEKAKAGPKFRAGQVIWLGYAAEYRRIFKVNEYGLVVGTKRNNVCVQFTDVRPLTARESGQRQRKGKP